MSEAGADSFFFDPGNEVRLLKSTTMKMRKVAKTAAPRRNIFLERVKEELGVGR